MLPELAAAYVAGLIPSAALTALQVAMDGRKRRSPAMRLLQKNLAGVDLYWAESHSQFRSLQDGSETADRESYLKSVTTLGAICFFLSWIGTFVQLVIVASAAKLAVPRLERVVFSSPLTSKTLSPDETRAALREIQTRVANASIPI